VLFLATKNNIQSDDFSGIIVRLFVEEGSFYNDASDSVRIDVGRWAPVLQVAIALVGDMTRDTNRSTAICDAGAESSNVTGLVTAGEPEFVVLAIDGNVFVVPLCQFLDSGFDRLHTTFLTHLLRAEIGVATSTIPVALERFGVEGNFDAPLFGDTDEKVPSDPEMITHRDTLTRADLEFPLGGHDLRIYAANVNASIQAGAIMGFDEITSEDFPGTC